MMKIFIKNRYPLLPLWLILFLVAIPVYSPAATLQRVARLSEDIRRKWPFPAAVRVHGVVASIELEVDGSRRSVAAAATFAASPASRFVRFCGEGECETAQAGCGCDCDAC